MGSERSSVSDRYLGYSPSTRHDRSQHYFSSNNALDNIAASSTESPLDAPSSSSSSSIHASYFRGYSVPERERERYRYDSDGRLLEQNQKSSPTASSSSSPTQQQQQQQQPHPRAPQHQHHQHQFLPYHHQQHQSHNSIHHYPQYSQPSSSMHESSSGIQQHRVVGLPMGSHLPTVGFINIDSPKKDDNDRRSSPVVAQAAVNNNNGRPSMQAHALPPSTSWERGEHEHEHERGQRASSEVINGNNNNNDGGGPHYRYPIHSHTYPPSVSNSNRNNPIPLQPSSSSSSSPPSSASSPSSSSSSVSPSSSSPLSSSSSSPISTAARLASNHPPSETTSVPLPLLISTSTAGALPLSTATVPWNRSSLRHEIISMESPPPPPSSASFHSLHFSSSSRHSDLSHGHTQSHSSSSTTPSPPHSATHSPTTTVMKTPPHSTPDSSSSPETQRRSRPTIPTISTTTTPFPPPSAEPPSTMVVSSPQNPSGKVGVGRPPTSREEEEEDDPPETDTGSTFDSGQQKRRGSALTMTEEEDQEVSRAAAAGAIVGRERGGKGGEQSSIMRAQRATHYASQAAAAGGAGGDEYDYDRDRDEDRATGSPVSPSSLSSSSSSFLPSPHTTTSSSHGRINNNNSINSNNSSIHQQQQQQQRRIRPDQPFRDSPPPPPVVPSSKRDHPPQHSSSYPQQQQQQSIDFFSQEYHHQQKRIMGKASGPSLASSSSTTDHPSLSSSSSQPLSSPFSLSTGTQQGAAPPAHGRFSPSMNYPPLSFDQTGHTPNYPPVQSPSAPSLNNKRRSLADLLFVPTKIKAKRNSSSSVSSVDSSYRQDETGQELSGNVNVSWSNHPKSASATSTTSTSSTGSMSGSAGLSITSFSNVPSHHYQQHHHQHQQQQQQQQQQRMSLESQASPPARKSSTVKGVGKGAGSSGLGSSSSPKTFQCTGYPGCNMVFTRSEHLARHERKHTGEKPYKCIVANCPRTFSRYDNMIQHTQTHSDRTKRDSLAAAASAAGVGSGPHSRSSSVQSTPLLPGRPKGGSSPIVFGPNWDEHHRRTQNNSPVASPYNASPAFFHHHHQQQQQHHHPYSPHHQHHPQQQQQQQPHHPTQWSLPSGAPAGSSPVFSVQYNSHHHGAESHPYLPGYQSPSTPVVRTLKPNSRSLPHLQARAQHMASSSFTTESPSVGLQQSMSTMEIEELKRRKSEVLLSSSFSGTRATSSTSTGYGQGIGLGMSPFTPTTSHPQSLPQVEKLTAGEQERLNEHRRSAQAMFFKMNAGREGSMDTMRTLECSERCSSTGGLSQQQQYHQPLGVNTTLRSGSTGPALPQVQQLSALEKDRLLEHRKSTPELMYDAKMKRSSNDPADMVVQPLPSRDARSGMQWFSQISTPVTSSPRSSLTPREGNGGGGPSSVQVPGHSFSSSFSGPSSGDSSMILPPILGSYEEPQRDRQGHHRSHSSHIHPLSRPSTQIDPSSLAQFSSSEESKDQRQQFDTALSPRLERHWEEQYFPIRKRHVIETIEQMDSRDFLGLKYQVAEHHANEQFRNPEFLGNMTAILCVIRAPHTAWKGGERRQGSQGSVASASEQGSNFVGSRRTSRDMEVDEAEQRSMAAAAASKATVIKTEEGASAVKKEPISESMDVDDGSGGGGGQSATTSKDVVVQPCRFTLDIDVDSFSRDPEPDLRGFESLTINSLFPTRSFVAGFEDTPAESYTSASEKERYLSTHNGYPSNARLGRFYLPERSYRTLESLAIQPDPNDRWVCCRFEEYHGVSIWVLESVLDKYHEISRRHKMALTLVGATVHHREAVYSHEGWKIHPGEEYEVKAKESVLYPEMIHQVWRDMYYQHHQRAQYQHQQQQRAPPMPQVATYEEYQRSLMQSGPRRDSYQPQQQQQQEPPRDRSGPYYSYGDYRQQQQNLHREDPSSAPSSPQSPRHDDFPDESPQHHHQQYQQHQRQGSSASASANMHRRISIAELCNPMQSLATERAQRREETASKRTSM